MAFHNRAESEDCSQLSALKNFTLSILTVLIVPDLYPYHLLYRIGVYRSLQKWSSNILIMSESCPV